MSTSTSISNHDPRREKIVVYGPPHAGKTTAIHKIKHRLGGTLGIFKGTAEKFESALQMGFPPATVVLAGLALDTKVGDVGCRILSVTGSLIDNRMWLRLLEGASGVIYATGGPRVDDLASYTAILKEHLSTCPDTAVCVIRTRPDLGPYVSPSKIGVDCSIFDVNSNQSECYIAPLEYVVELIA